MAKPKNRKKKQIKTAKADLVLKTETQQFDPTPEQRQHAPYHRDEILHVETFTRAIVHRVRHVSSFRAMRDKEQISDDQYQAALEIAFVAEMIERNVSVRGASLEARVDHSGSARNALVERLGLIRAEKAYTDWRQTLPMPKRMVIDMVIEDVSLVSIARRYRVGWIKARKCLLAALDRWENIRAKTWKDVDERDVLWRYARLGDGELR
ncbi:hypothetical protein [Novosphingobium sp. 9]|uniref:hypothetical protein n=1 Tax=Novosphingobium sp. 9 TaxID=2025349 RepID=UPI0021B63327|nr:hypothetical protein [Novosphingobium sp. 9]